MRDTACLPHGTMPAIARNKGSLNCGVWLGGLSPWRGSIRPGSGRSASAWLADGRAVVVDRYVASGVAYGAAQGLDRDWMVCVERGLPTADLTILLDTTPEVSLSRKSASRDAYEARTDLLVRARHAYLDLARADSWRTIDATGDRESVWADVLKTVTAFAERR
jgi:thymidylate kinase